MTPTSTLTNTPTVTDTPTAIVSPTSTGTPTYTVTPTGTPAATAIFTDTPTITPTDTLTATNIPALTATSTNTPTFTATIPSTPTPTATVPTLPNAPSNLTAVRAGNTTNQKINLSWTDNSTNESNFVVDHSTDQLTWSALATLQANTRTTTDNSVLQKTTYFYRAKATNGVGRSPYTNVVSVTTKLPLRSLRDGGGSAPGLREPHP